MADLSIIIPAFKEPYIGKTIESVLKNSVGDIEVIAVLDAWSPDVPVPKDPRVHWIMHSQNTGMRGAINSGLKESNGKYIMKLDAHCLVAPGFDKEIIENMEDNWLVIPRRYSLDVDKWEVNKDRPVVDYHYLIFPTETESAYGFSLQVTSWPWMTQKRKRIEIDDVMTFQGSCWIANRDYFMKHVGMLDDSPDTYGSISHDQLEIGLKYWLGGGEVKVNKRTWYAHLNKRGYQYKNGTFSRKHKKDDIRRSGNIWGTKHWMNNEELGMVHDFKWFISKFMPIPSWPENWEEIWAKYNDG